MATSEEVQHYLISEFDADYGTDGKTMFIAHPSEHAFEELSNRLFIPAVGSG